MGSSQKISYRIIQTLKGTVLPDIAFHFRVYKFKSVLSVRPLMVFKFVYFVVLYIFIYTYIKTASMKILTNYEGPYGNPMKRAFTRFPAFRNPIHSIKAAS